MKAIITTLSGLAVFGFGLWTDFWIRGCSEEISDNLNYTLGNACQERGIGFQAAFLVAGATLAFYGLSLIRRTK